jgi:hypothetical protein
MKNKKSKEVPFKEFVKDAPELNPLAGHTEDCQDANDDTSVLKGKCICPEPAPLDFTGDIIAYEQGELDEDGVINLFQNLINSGLAWTLQGSYGRTAKALIDAGVCQLGKVARKDYWGNTVPARKAEVSS